MTVLALEGAAYVEHCQLKNEGAASSRLLDGFSVDVAALFAAGKL